MMIPEQLKRLLETIRSHQIEGYLIEQGWRRDGDLGNRASIWHRPEEEFRRFEILLPNLQNSKDYLARVADVMFVLSEYEQREPAEVARATSGYFADHFSVRVIHEDVEEGSIPLHDGVLLNLRARDLMASSTLSTITKRKQFFGKRPPEVQQFLESLRLGQTEIGSYIVNVIAPLKAEPVDIEAIATTSLTRLVTANLAASLTALSNSIDRYAVASDPTVFESAVASGVSANMCDALIGLSGESKSRGFEIKITPSSGDNFEMEPRTFLFTSEKVQFISAASEYYKDDYVLPDQTVMGFVKRLDRPAGEEIGTITIQATLSGMEKNVSVELEPDDYMLALAAHKANEVVVCRGDVHVKSRSAVLLNHVDFHVVRSDDLFPED